MLKLSRRLVSSTYATGVQRLVIGGTCSHRHIFIPISTHTPDDGKECTLYIKGFLAKGENADRFETWQRGHKVLANTHRWGSTAHGYFWDSGDLPGSLVPYASLLTGAYQLLTMKKLLVTPQGIAITAAAEACMIGGRFWYEFKKAADTAKAHGPNLAAHIQEISKRYPYVRVVAHSLGCALLLEALKVLPENQKPHEIHFLAPVINEEYLHHDIAKEHAYLYHCATDFALQTASALFYQQKQLVGLVGPTKKWRGLTSVDASKHFGFFVHTNYRHVLDKVIVDHRKSYAPNSDAETIMVTERANEEAYIVEQVPFLETDTIKLDMGLKLLQQQQPPKEEVSPVMVDVARPENTIGGAINSGIEILKVSKALFGSVRGMLENKTQIVLDNAKNVAGMMLANSQLLQGKKAK